MKHCSAKTFLWLALKVIYLQSISVAGQQCELHESKDSEGCCIASTIKEGYQPVMCDTDGEKVLSEPCPANTYQPKELSSLAFRMCERHSTCTLPNLIRLRSGNSTSNTICKCNEGEGYYDSRPHSDSSVPPESYQCLFGEIVSPSSSVSSVHQSSPVHSVTSGYPTETSSSIPTSVNVTGTSFVAIAACVVVIVVIIVIVVVVLVVCRKKKCRVFYQRRKESPECPPTVRDQSSMLLNGQIPDVSNAAETDAHLLLNVNESSNVPVENGYGSDATVGSQINYNLRSDDENSTCQFTSLCECRS